MNMGNFLEIEYEKYIQCCYKGRHKYGDFFREGNVLLGDFFILGSGYVVWEYMIGHVDIDCRMESVVRLDHYRE